MKKWLIIPVFMVGIIANAQLPFSTKTVKNIKVTQKSDNGEDVIPDNNNNADFFSEQTAGVLLTDDGSKLFPTISSSVIKYNFLMYSKKKVDDKGNVSYKRTYLPFFITTNVSGANLASKSTAEVADATSYFGSVLSFRLSPSIKIKSGEENTLVLGLSNDLRIFTVGDTVQQKVNIALGYYGAAGISYFGNGTVTDADGKEYGGKFGMSAILYWFKSKGKFNEAIFSNPGVKSWLTGFEFLLKFKPSNEADSKFKLFLGAKYDFSKESPTKNTWNFRLGIGN